MDEPRDVRLASGGLEAVIRPAFGGQIASFRCSGRELLDPGSPRAAEQVDPLDYLSGGLGGIDDCFPAIAPGVHPTHGVAIPDHGELWHRPAAVTGRGRDGLTLRMVGERLPFTLERRMSLAPSSLQVEYLLEHTADGELSVSWAAHPLFAASPGMSIALPGTLDRAYSASPGVRLTPEGRLRTRTGEVDLTSWEAIPAGTYAKLFGRWAGPVALTHPAWNVTLTVELEAPRPAQLGLWLNRGGYPPDAPTSHIAIEPAFGDSDDLGATIGTRSCLRLGPRERISWSVAYRVSEQAPA